MHPIIANLIIVTMLIAILASLGYSLFYLLLDRQNGNRTFKGLAIRIFLSMLLFIGIILAIYVGWITPGPPPL